MERARGAALQPVPGSTQRRHSARSSRLSSLGTCPRIAASPGGRVKFTSRGAAPCSCISA
eukprot:2332816-Pyramimonas_sp.AAC.1